MKNQSYIIYALWPGVQIDDLSYEINQLGRMDYQVTQKWKFTKHQGWILLETLINENREDILNSTIFKTSLNKELSLEKVMNLLKNSEFRR